MKIFPQIEVKEDRFGISLCTYLRKKHKGKWYTQCFYKSMVYAKDRDKAKNDLFKVFIMEIYHTIILGKVAPDMVIRIPEPPFSLPAYPIDKNQDSEEDRLTKILKL